MTAPPDTALISATVRRLLDGKKGAQGELVDLIQARLFKFCIVLTRNREVAEDLTQETLLKCLQNIRTLKNPEIFVAWMFQIAKNLYIDFTRKPGGNNLPIEDFGHLASDTDMDLILNVQKVLAQFDPEEKFLLLLIELEGCSYKEAGEILHMTEDAVRSKLHRLRILFIKKHDTGETK